MPVNVILCEDSVLLRRVSLLPRMSAVGYYVNFLLFLYCKLIFNSEPNKNNIIQHYQQLTPYIGSEAQWQHAAGSVICELHRRRFNN